jgi:hypothetical protein
MSPLLSETLAVSPWLLAQKPLSMGNGGDALGRRVARQRPDPGGCAFEQTHFTRDGPVLAGQEARSLARVR